MRNITVFYRPYGTHDEAELSADIEAVQFAPYGPGQILIDHVAIGQIISLFKAGGYMEHIFKIVVDDTRLIACRIISHGERNVISFLYSRAPGEPETPED